MKMKTKEEIIERIDILTEKINRYWKQKDSNKMAMVFDDISRKELKWVLQKQRNKEV